MKRKWTALIFLFVKNYPLFVVILGGYSSCSVSYPSPFTIHAWLTHSPTYVLQVFCQFFVSYSILGTSLSLANTVKVQCHEILSLLFSSGILENHDYTYSQRILRQNKNKFQLLRTLFLFYFLKTLFVPRARKVRSPP